MNRSHIEHDNQAAFFKWAEFQLSIYPQLKWMYAIPNSARRSPRQGAWMKAEGMKSGVWDIHLPWPVGKYHGLWIEMKSGNNQLTENQMEFQYNLHDFYAFSICYNYNSAINAVIQYLAGERF